MITGPPPKFHGTRDILRKRSCYEGWVTYLHDGYGPGDLRDCVGWHWSGHWKDDGAQRYIQRIDHYLDSKPWLDWTDEHR